MNTVFVSARIAVKPGCSEAWLKATLANIVLVRAETGCLRYDLHTASERPCAGAETFLFYEIWANADALHAHAHSEHMKTYHEATAQCVESATVETWQAVAVA